MIAGTAKVDITPKGSVWMDGMIREHRSDDVHDPLFVRVLYMSDGDVRCAVVTLDVCGVHAHDTRIIREKIEDVTGIPSAHIIIAASHTHSGPATYGYFNPAETDYVKWMASKIVEAVKVAVDSARPVLPGCASGREETISRYRRFLSGDGKVVMLWEQDPSLGGLTVMGVPDPEVGVLKLVDTCDSRQLVAILYNHAGHPNVMSGDNYAISADYPGAACQILEDKFGCTALFTNGAQGSVDIDNWKWRDWDGVEHIGSALAKVVMQVIEEANTGDAVLRISNVNYAVPRRKISNEELLWAEDTVKRTGGKIQAVADGVGDDYKALLYKKINEAQTSNIEIEQICIAIGSFAFLSFPGELFTEIGMEIKRKSPFERTFIIDLANGYIGYVPTKDAISQGGYEVDTRELDEQAEDLIVEKSLELLNKVKIA